MGLEADLQKPRGIHSDCGILQERDLEHPEPDKGDGSMKYICQKCGEEIESAEPIESHGRQEPEGEQGNSVEVQCGPVYPVHRTGGLPVLTDAIL